MKPAAVLRQDGDRAWIDAPYGKEWIDAFKNGLPSVHRGFDSTIKQWWVNCSHVDLAIYILSQFFNVIKPESMIDPYRQFISLADESMLKKIYQIMALKHHPDRGGDCATMAKINAALDRIMAEREKT